MVVRFLQIYENLYWRRNVVGNRKYIDFKCLFAFLKPGDLFFLFNIIFSVDRILTPSHQTDFGVQKKYNDVLIFN